MVVVMAVSIAVIKIWNTLQQNAAISFIYLQFIVCYSFLNDYKIKCEEKKKGKNMV